MALCSTPRPSSRSSAVWPPRVRLCPFFLLFFPVITWLCVLISSQESVPPVMAFHLGSLGFLTPFKFDTYQTQVTQIIEGTSSKWAEDLFTPISLQSTHGFLQFLDSKEDFMLARRQRRHRAAQPLESASDEGQHGEESPGGWERHHPDQRRRREQLEGRAVPGDQSEKNTLYFLVAWFISSCRSSRSQHKQKWQLKRCIVLEGLAAVQRSSEDVFARQQPQANHHPPSPTAAHLLSPGSSFHWIDRVALQRLVAQTCLRSHAAHRPGKQLVLFVKLTVPLLLILNIFFWFQPLISAGTDIIIRTLAIYLELSCTH